MSAIRPIADPKTNRSLVWRLAVNILLVVLLTFGIVFAFVAYRANIVSNSISEESLEIRLDQIMGSINFDESGNLDLVIPEALRSAFSTSSHDNIYIVKSTTSDVIWTSHPELQRMAMDWVIDRDDGTLISIDNVFSDRDVFYGISRKYETQFGNFAGLVAQYEDARDFARYISSEFIEACLSG